MPGGAGRPRRSPARSAVVAPPRDDRRDGFPRVRVGAGRPVAASYARRTEPVYRALMRVQADVETSAPDASFRADLSAADAAAARWSRSLSPAERRRHSCQYLKTVLAAYDALPRHRAEVRHGEQAKDWDLVDDAQRGIDNALRWAPQTLAQARVAVDAGD